MGLLRTALTASAAGFLMLGCSGGPAPAGTGSATPAPSSGASAAARTPDTGAAVRLRRGGHILYFRHAATVSTQDAATPDLSDPGTQRRLSAGGREQARETGDAVRRLGIPIGQVLVSPYDRTRETATLAFGPERVRDAPELLNALFPGTDDDELAEGLRRLLRQRPAAGTNTVLVSHGVNLTNAIGLTLAEGEAAVFDPGGRDPLAPVARITAGEWRSLSD